MRKRLRQVSLVLPAAVLAGHSLAAQDVGPALDPGLTVGYAGGEAVRYDNERRSKSASARNAVTPSQRKACGNLPSFRSQHGASDPRVQFLERQCRAKGL